MGAQWPLIVQHLVTYLPALPGWTGDVFDGAARDVQSATFTTVGHSNNALGTDRGTYTKRLHTDGSLWIEEGTVNCLFASSDDTSTLAGVSAAVFAQMNTLEAAVRADRTLGVLSPEGLFDLAVNISALQIVPGSGQKLPFALNYLTVT